MATVVEYTVGGTDPNYATLSSWSADMNALYPSGFPAAGVIPKAVVQALIDVTASISISGGISDRDHYKWITAKRGESIWDLRAPGDPLRGPQPGAGIRNAINASTRINISEYHVLMEKMVWLAATTSASSPVGMLSLLGNDITVRDSYFYNNNASAQETVGQIVVGGLRNKLINVHASFDGSDSSFVALEFGGDATSDANAPSLIACSFTRPSDRTSTSATYAMKKNGISSRKARIRSTVFFGFGALFYTGNGSEQSFTSDSDYNATNLAAGSTVGTDLFPGSNNKYESDIPGPGTWATAGKVYVNTTLAGGDFRPAAGSAIDNVSGAQVNSGFPNPDPTSNPVDGPQLREGTGNWAADGAARSPTAPTLGALEYTALNDAVSDSVGVTRSYGSNSGGSKRVRVGPLLDAAGDPVVDLTNLEWAFFDQTKASALLEPVDKGNNGATDAAGYFEMAIPNSALDPDDTGFLVVDDNSTGDPEIDWDGFHGPVKVL